MMDLNGVLLFDNFIYHSYRLRQVQVSSC